jgi:hypothetical protein
VPYRFNVLTANGEPGIGDAAPPSRQATTADVADITEIDSSSPPRPSMHDTTVADAVASGRPSVIAFATPAFCRSRTCAPVMETIMDPLSEQYGGRVNFLHVEPYVLSELRTSNVQVPVEATLEWRLRSEPWVFVVDAGGRIVGRFEGIVAPDEVESVLELALDAPGVAVTPAPTAATPASTPAEP